MMLTEKQKAILHYGRTLVRKRRIVDKKGVAIALIFLLAIALWAAWHRHQTSEQATSQQEADRSGEITIRPAGKSGLEGESDQPVHSLAGQPGALHDPRQGR
jgi:predicted negative regulator of RcsB-dependent stress response